MTECLVRAPTAPTAGQTISKALIDEAQSARADGISRRRLQYFGPEGKIKAESYSPKILHGRRRPLAARSITGTQGRCLRDRECVYWLENNASTGCGSIAVHRIVEIGEISMLHDLSVEVRRIEPRQAAKSILSALEKDDNRASVWITGKTRRVGKV